MEQLTLKKMREFIGWPEGEGDGIFSPGRSQTSYSTILYLLLLNVKPIFATWSLLIETGVLFQCKHVDLVSSVYLSVKSW